jgi:hypothetical protein
MRKVVVGAFLSLDGVMQSLGGPHEDPVGGFRRPCANRNPTYQTIRMLVRREHFDDRGKCG